MNRSSQHCVGCESLPPKTDTSYTLIEHGWRLTVALDDDGRKKTELWCPSCWAAHHANAPEPPSSSHAIASMNDERTARHR